MNANTTSTFANNSKTVAGRTRNTVVSGYRNTRDAVARGYRQFRGMSVVAQALIGIVVIVLLILLIIWIYNMVEDARYTSRQSPFIITKPVNAFRRNNRPVKTERVPRPLEGLAFTYSFWMYVANWNYRFGDWKNILIKGNDRQFAPAIWLYPKMNSLHFRMSTNPDTNEGCDVRNIPLQKWVHVVYVLNNRNVDIYIDGKLERSCVLRGVPVLNNQPVQVARDGGFFGQLAKMQYFTRALLPNEVSSIYSEGPYISGGFHIFGGNNENGDDGNGDDCDYDNGANDPIVPPQINIIQSNNSNNRISSMEQEAQQYLTKQHM